jgi:hypothetical protein
MSRFFGALPDTMMNMGNSYIFTVKSTSHVICAVWAAKEFSLQLSPDMARMIVDQVSARCTGGGGGHMRGWVF